MLGTFQRSHLRIELEASASAIHDSLLYPENFRQWLFPQSFSAGVPDLLKVGTVFVSWVGPISIHHSVAQTHANGLRMVLSQGIDGFHDWVWGDGWVQSSLEGISLLPLNLGQTYSLLRLREFLNRQNINQVTT